MTFILDKNESEIDIVLINKEHRRFMRNVKAIPGEFQHALVIADIDKKKIRTVLKRNVLREER